MARGVYDRNGETIAGDASIIEAMALRDHESFVGKKLLTKDIVVTEAGGYTVGFPEPVLVLVEPMRPSDIIAQGWRDLPSGLAFSPLWKVRVLPPIPPGAKEIVDPRIEPVRSYVSLGSKGVQVDFQQCWVEASAAARTTSGLLQTLLEAATSRDEADRVLRGTRKADLIKLSKELEVRVQSSDSTDRIVEKIVEATVGARLRGAAIRGDSPESRLGRSSVERAPTAEELEREAKSDRERAERRAKILAFKRACAHLRATGQHAKADDLESRLDRAEGTSWRVVD